MRSWWPRRRRAEETEPAVRPDSAPEGSRAVVAPVDLRVSGRDGIGAAGDVRGNAIGPGSSTTHIDQIVVNPPAAPGRLRARQIAPPLVGAIADRKSIREELHSMLLTPGQHGRGPVAFLEGYGGGGKTTLALQAGHTEAIKKQFPGGVIWTVVGQSRVGPKLADHIGDICDHLSGRRPATTDPALAGAALGELLDEGPPVLLVVDDVWFRDQVEPFLTGGSACARLFTTRNRGVCPAYAKVIEVGEMNEEEARATALADLPGLDAVSIANLLAFAKGWPVLLGLINASLRMHIRAGGPPDEVTSFITKLIDSEGPAALDPASPQHLRSSIGATVSASLNLLSEAEQQRYFELAIFDEDVDVPDHIVELLWEVTGGLSRADSRLMKGRLSALRLVHDRWADNEPATAVHDVLRSYILHLSSQEDLARRNRALVEALRNLLPAGRRSQWWRLPDTEKFALEQIPFHLRSAGLDEELAALVTDLRWVEAQIRQLGSVVPAVSALATVPGDKAAELRAVLDRDTELLTPAAAPSATGGTLVSRLQHVETLRVAAAEHLARLPRPVLRTRWPLPDTTSTRDDGHTGPIGDCAISPDGTLVATASDDRLVIIWDIADLGVRRVLRGHRQRARACVFSPDGTRLLSASMDGTIRIWSVADGTLLQTLGDPSTRALGCAWSPDGRFVASAAGNGKLTIWDADTGDKHGEVDSPSGYEWDCAFSPDSSIMVSAAEDGTIRLWDVAECKPLAEHAVHEGRIRCCVYDGSGAFIATAGSDTTVRILRADTGEVVHVLRGHSGRVRACAFSADGRRLASASEDRTVMLWDVATGRRIGALEGHADWVGAAVFTPDGEHLLSCGGDITLRNWSVGSDELVRTAAATGTVVGCCSFAPDGTRLASGGSDGTAYVIDTVGGTILQSVPAHTGRVLDCTFTSAGLLTVGADAEVCLWDPRDGREVRRYSGHSGRIWGSCIAPDNRQIASAGEDGLVLVHDVETGEVIHRLRGHAGHALDCAFSPSGEFIASVGDDGTLRLWERTGGQLVATHSTGRETAVWSCQYSPDGELIATVGEPAAGLTVWSAAAVQIKAVIAIGVDRITSCAFSPSGRQIAACGDDAYLGVWDVATGDPLCGVRVAYPLHECAWTDLDGQSLLAAAGNGGSYLFEYVDLA